jgi:hypothetical protein
MVIHFNKNKNKIAKVIKSSKEIALQKLIYWRGYFLSLFFLIKLQGQTHVYLRGCRRTPWIFKIYINYPIIFFIILNPLNFIYCNWDPNVSLLKCTHSPLSLKRVMSCFSWPNLFVLLWLSGHVHKYLKIVL